jgi:hypothetical protein
MHMNWSDVCLIPSIDFSSGSPVARKVYPTRLLGHAREPGEIDRRGDTVGDVSENKSMKNGAPPKGLGSSILHQFYENV